MNLNLSLLTLTPKIGVTPEGESKFQSWSGQSGYYRKPDVKYDPYKTDKMYSGGFTKSELVANATLCGTLRESNKSKVETKFGGTQAQTLSRSRTMESYINQRSWNDLLLEYGTSDRFCEAFNEFLIDPTNKINDSNEDGEIWIQDVEKCVKYCLTDTVPEFVLDRFVILSRKYIVQNRLKWRDFRDVVIPHVVSTVQAECQYRRELPALLQLMNKPREVDPQMGALGDLSTVYRDNFNRAADLVPMDKPDEFTFTSSADESAYCRVPLNATSKLLCAGTVKGTLQVPGYKGHMPRNVRNPRKLEHSIGLEVHPVQNNLTLTQRGLGCVLGYAGNLYDQNVINLPYRIDFFLIEESSFYKVLMFV
mmetsp:Transcript_12973/g.19518  ORF Transcript_12973/g.19518 Transcript_12973/m.19518 type:complete len:365 (+) Transcript_12973:44-1138(+)